PAHARRRAAVRHRQAGRARARPRRRTATAAPRRAGERPEPRGSGGARRLDPRVARPPRPDDPARRASHEPRHERLRQGGGTELRTQDRRGRSGAGSRPPRGRRGLSRCGCRLSVPAAQPQPGPRGSPPPTSRTPAATAPSAPLLAVRDLYAAYGPTQVLHGISLELATGSITALLGANGAGKTTTLRALCSMTVRTRGEVWVD